MDRQIWMIEVGMDKVEDKSILIIYLSMFIVPNYRYQLFWLNYL